MSLVLTALLSSCSGTSFLQRQYTPGVFVQHRDKVLPVNQPVSQAAVRKASVLNSLNKGSELRHTNQPNDALHQPADKVAGSQKTNTATPLAGKKKALYLEMTQPVNAFSELKKKRLSNLGDTSIRGSVKSSRPAEDDDDSRTTLTQGLSALVFFALSILVYLVLKRTVFVGIQAAALLSALHIFFIFCAVVLIIIAIGAVTYGFRSIKQARAQGVPVPKKTILGITLAIVSLLLLLLFASLVLVF